jgi:hypothetical protein
MNDDWQIIDKDGGTNPIVLFILIVGSCSGFTFVFKIIAGVFQ